MASAPFCDSAEHIAANCDDCIAGNLGGKYYDSQCNEFYGAGGTEVCGTMEVEYLVSPISLVWEKGFDIESELSFSSFPLDPGKSGKVYVWKGSEKAPLLVYDPEHTGKIVSAFQLFGDWTFGGKKLASLGSGTDISKTKWKDGYEALATLDQDKDGVIAGRELQPLGLWFDKNRDGVSQQGEVQAVTDTGVVKIFTTADRTDELSRAVHATVGYERVVDGRTVRGASVDWYAKGASTSAELISGIMAKSQLCSLPGESPVLQETQPHGAVKKSSLNGLWKWKTTRSGESGDFGGFLTFRENPDGTIAGHT